MKKNCNIHIPAGKNVFYANFRTKRNDPMRGVLSVQVNRSTGSSDRKTAQAIANRMRDQERLGLFDAVPKLRDDCPTVGKIADRYLARAKIKTKGDVVREFLTVVAEGAGMVLEGVSVRESKVIRAKARDLKLSALTASAMITFRDRKQEREPASINRLMRTARSIFADDMMEHYRDLKLPDLKGWLGAAMLEDKSDPSYKPIPEQILAQMDGSAIMMLRLARRHGIETPAGTRWLNAWITYWLMRRAGLRNIEVENHEWDWYVKRGGRIWLELTHREGWNPKGSAGVVPIADDLYQMILDNFGPATKGPVLKGTQKARWDGTHVQVNTFIRRFIKDRGKASYELRKQWGSEMAMDHGLDVASMLLRHASSQTSRDHYYALLALDKIPAR